MIYFGKIKYNSDGNIEDVSIESIILLRNLPLKCLLFINNKQLIGGGYDNIPILFEKENISKCDKWINKGYLICKINDNTTILKHENYINSIQLINSEKGLFSTSSSDGKLLIWDINRSHTSTENIALVC